MRLLILVSIALIFSLGLIMVFNTSSAEVLDRSLNQSLNYALLKQITYAIVGCLCAVLVWRIGYDHLLHLSYPLLVFGLLLLLIVFIPGIGSTRGGAKRWIILGGFSFQPSEFVKYIMPMAYIEYIRTHKDEVINFKKFLKIAIILGIPVMLVAVEPDNGTAAVMGASLLPLFYVSGIRFKYWAMPFLVLISVCAVVAFQLPYVKARIQVYLHPELDVKGKGHQPHQAKIAAGSGKLLGRGAGASLQKLTYLPEAQNDYIAAIYAEEFGFIGMLVLLFLYLLFAYGGFSIAINASHISAQLLAMVITFLISLQAFLNLGVASGLLPSKGINLPFFSQGGTSLVANIAAIAILLNIPATSEKAVCNFLKNKG